MKVIKKIVGLTFVLFALQLKSQTEVLGKAFVKDGTVYLRWGLADGAKFAQVGKAGFEIKRMQWRTNTMPSITDFLQAETAANVIPKSKTDASWNLLVKQNTLYAAVYKLLFASEKMTDTKGVAALNYIYGLTLLSCDRDTSVAKRVGLFFEETLAKKETYAYVISSLDKTATIKPLVLVVNTGINSILPEITDLHYQIYKRDVRLSWDNEKIKTSYTGYYVERSLDGKTFEILNKLPVTQTKTDTEKNKTDMLYKDSTGAYNTPYIYRVQGLTIFGVKSAYSNTLQAQVIKPLQVEVIIDSLKFESDSIPTVYFKTRGQTPKSEIKGYHVYRSDNDSAGFKRITSTLLPADTKKFGDKQALQNGYYHVVAYNLWGDSVVSFNSMSALPDIHPPAMPKGLRGVVDSLGRVTVNWDANTEADFKGYRVFRYNALHEEPVERTRYFLTQTEFKDTIELNTLTKNVLYVVTAVDKVFNNSPYSKPLVLKRPDKIKPVGVVFTKLYSNDSTINLRWNNSTSDDVKTYTLYRNDGAKTEYLKTWLANDTTKTYSDKTLKPDAYYTYRMDVMDSSNNVQSTVSKQVYYNTRFKKAVEGFGVVVNKELMELKISWQGYSEKVFSYEIFRSTDGSGFDNIATFGAKVTEFKDKNVSSGHIYKYKMRVVLDSGHDTKFSKVMEIKL